MPQARVAKSSFKLKQHAVENHQDIGYRSMESLAEECFKHIIYFL